ncbi:MAG: hypothetical protein WBP66_04820, partial [Azonexus sp.]
MIGSRENDGPFILRRLARNSSDSLSTVDLPERMKMKMAAVNRAAVPRCGACRKNRGRHPKIGIGGSHHRLRPCHTTRH